MVFAYTAPHLPLFEAAGSVVGFKKQCFLKASIKTKDKKIITNDKRAASLRPTQQLAMRPVINIKAFFTFVRKARD